VRSPISLRFAIAPAKSAMPYTPWLFRIQLEHTPSLNDPKGSRDFYEALGVLVVAWGRLEGHFLACVWPCRIAGLRRSNLPEAGLLLVTVRRLRQGHSAPHNSGHAQGPPSRLDPCVRNG
jgi:hypothetical protein